MHGIVLSQNRMEVASNVTHYVRLSNWNKAAGRNHKVGGAHLGHNKGGHVGKRPEVGYTLLQEGHVVLAKRQSFRLRPEAGRFVRSFSSPCPVLWFQYLRDFLFYYNILFLPKHLINLLTRGELNYWELPHYLFRHPPTPIPCHLFIMIFIKYFTF